MNNYIDEDSRVMDQQLARWNKKTPKTIDCCVHDLISQRFKTQPEVLAICAWDGNLTYNELDQLSSALAIQLSDRGVGPEVFVPLFFEKSRWTTVAMLAVMKSGGAFVLLDTSYPEKRLQAICKTIGAPFVVASQSNATAAASLFTEVILVGGDVTQHSDAESRCLTSAASPHNAVYAVFTSGSTGKPKAVVIEHANLCSSATAFNEAFSMTSESRVLQFASYAFDASICENLATLLAGGCICIPSDYDRTSDIVQAINKFQVNWALLTPTVSRIINPMDIPSLKTLVLGGEAMGAEDINRWSGHLRLLNAYGPAECAVVSTVHTSIHKSSQSNNIGFGTAAAACWIVDPDDHNNLVSIGSVGELLLEGPVVGRGYLNEPDITAAAFVESPAWLSNFRQTDPGRVYKTGDLARYNEDGSIQFTGRKDLQIKIRGQRLELGEVEHYLKQIFLDAGAVIAEVVIPAQGGRAPTLVAFIWSDCDKNGSSRQDSPNRELFKPPTEEFTAEVRSASRQMYDSVPDFMVPSVFLPLSYVPVTPTGKTDRLLLREQAAVMQQQDTDLYNIGHTSKRMPTTEMERVLQRLWAEVLNLPSENVGLDDNFFRIGGDSIAAMKLASFSRQKGLEFSVSSVFSYPTISALSLIVNKISINTAPTQPKPGSLLPVPDYGTFLRELDGPGQHFDIKNVADILPTTEFQRFYLNLRLSDYFLLDIPVSVDEDRLEAACKVVVKKHAVLRSVWIPHKDDTFQVILRDTEVKLNKETTDDDLDTFSASFCQKDSDPRVPWGVPNFQVTLISPASDSSRHILVIRVSHGQYDGISFPLVCQDILSAYQGKCIESSAPVSFSLYMQQRLSKNTSSAYQFWNEYLKDSEMTHLNRVSEREQVPPHKSLVGTMKQVPLPKPPSGITLSMLIRAGWALALVRLTGRKDIVFGHTVSGRDVPLEGAETVIGACVTTALLRVGVQKHWTHLDLLRHVQNQYTSTVTYENLDFKDIVAQSTSWPKDTEIGSVITQANFGSSPIIQLDDGVNCTIKPTFLGIPDKLLQTTYFPVQIFYTTGDTTLDLALFASTDTCDQDGAVNMFEKFCDAITEISLDPQQVLCLDG